MKPISHTPSLKHLLAAAALAMLSLQGQAAVGGTTAYSGVYVFGDSLSDGGNNRLVLGGDGAGQVITDNSYIPSLPYASGTYSNGPVWFNTFAAGLGLQSFAGPSLVGGGDYAYGGARTLVDGSFSNFPPSTQTQLSGFLTNGAGVSPNAIYVLASGGNDVRAAATAIAGGADPTATIGAGAMSYASTTAGMVGSLVAAGATPKNIVVWNVPNVGLAPASLALGPAAAAGVTAISSSFNMVLSGALATSGVTMFDVYGLVAAAAASGQFTNLTDACGAAVNNCNPATALFWDGIHPTAAAHAFVGNQMLAAVPEPGAVWMFMAGLVVLGGLRLRRG